MGRVTGQARPVKRPGNARSRRVAALGGATAHPINFGVLSGSDFERLVFAFLCRRWSWRSLAWHGQTGDDGGRDIVGVRDDDWGRHETVVVACANWRRLTMEKIRADLEKIVGGETQPALVIFAGGGKVSADLRRKAAVHASTIGISRVEVWSGMELEEGLRAYAGTVIARFFGGEMLPADATELRMFAAETMADEQEGLRIVARIFDRPAFTTRLNQESSLPAFRVALGNTIEALNTGLWRTRDGVLIARLPSKNDFQDPHVRAGLVAAVTTVVEMRTRFDDLLREGNIKPCSCSQPDCSVFMVDDHAVRTLNGLRIALFDGLRRLIPEVFETERWLQEL